MGSSIKRIRYRYDARGNRKALIDQDGGRFTYSYDAVSRITQVINPQGDRTSYSYDAAGRRTVKKLANGTRASFSYDNVGNLTRLANLKGDGTTISSFNYRYDEVGNRTSVLEADGSRVTWSYDDTYQLTGEHRTGSHAYRNTFAYDPAGNRTLKNEDGARTTYSYDAANQLTKSVDASGTTTYTFDEDGNQQVVEAPNGDRTTMSWDGENRMTSVQQPDGTRNTMAYEPGGLRVKLEESAGTKKFVWDEQNYLAETDENDDTQVVYTNEPRVYGNLVSQRRGTDSHSYHFDAIGSTRELTDDSETVTDTRLYDAWGRILESNGSSIVSLQYAGEAGYFLNPDAFDFYVRARCYSASIARWASRDPLYPIWSRHLYQYTSNSPTTSSDPSGLVQFLGASKVANIFASPAFGTGVYHLCLEVTLYENCDDPCVMPEPIETYQIELLDYADRFGRAGGTEDRVGGGPSGIGWEIGPGIIIGPHLDHAWGIFVVPGGHCKEAHQGAGVIGLAQSTESIPFGTDQDQCDFGECLINKAKEVAQSATNDKVAYHVTRRNSNSFIGEVLCDCAGLVEAKFFENHVSPNKAPGWKNRFTTGEPHPCAPVEFE